MAKVVRQRVAQIVELDIVPARVRKTMDREGINQEVEVQLTGIREKLAVIKKAGGPVKPVAPTPLKRTVTDAAIKKKHQEARDKYLADLKVWTQYSSAQYQELKTIHNLVRLLQSLVSQLTKNKPMTAAREAKIKAIVGALGDQMPAQGPKESAEAFAKRQKRFKPRGYSKLLPAGLDFKDADAVQAQLNKFRASNTSLDLLAQKDAEAKKRVRFSDQAGIIAATFIETCLSEVTEVAVNGAIDDRRRTLQPDHAVTAEAKKCSMYPLFAKLAHWQSVKQRQERKRQWEEKKQLAMNQARNKARLAAQRAGKKTKMPKIEFTSFPETEVQNSHAVKTTVAVEDENGKPVLDDKGNVKQDVTYTWVGIEHDEVGWDSSDFSFYAAKVASKVIDSCAMAGVKGASGLHISANYKKFLSDLAVDFVRRLSPQIQILTKAMNIKTVSGEVVTYALTQLLTASYTDGSFKLHQEHADTMELALKKVETYKGQRTTVAAAKDDDEVLGHSEDPTASAPAEADDLADEPLADPTPVPVAEKAAPATAAPAASAARMRAAGRR